jgi:hypothetical protein
LSLSATVYQQAQARLTAKKGDDRDEVIVALWNLNHASVNEILAQRMVISQQQRALDAAALKIASDTFDSNGMLQVGVMAAKLPDVAHIQH